YLFGYAIGLLFVGIVGLTDGEFGLESPRIQKMQYGAIADRALQLQDRMTERVALYSRSSCRRSTQRTFALRRVGLSCVMSFLGNAQCLAMDLIVKLKRFESNLVRDTGGGPCSSGGRRCHTGVRSSQSLRGPRGPLGRLVGVRDARLARAT